MLRDVEFFQSRLGKIDGFEDAGDFLVKIIKSNKILAPEPVPEPAPAPAPAPTPSAAVPAASAASDGGDKERGSTEEPGAAAQAQEGTAAQAEKNGDSNGASKA